MFLLGIEIAVQLTTVRENQTTAIVIIYALSMEIVVQMQTQIVTTVSVYMQYTFGINYTVSTLQPSKRAIFLDLSLFGPIQIRR